MNNVKWLICIFIGHKTTNWINVGDNKGNGDDPYIDWNEREQCERCGRWL